MEEEVVPHPRFPLEEEATAMVLPQVHPHLPFLLEELDPLRRHPQLQHLLSALEEQEEGRTRATEAMTTTTRHHPVVVDLAWQVQLPLQLQLPQQPEEEEALTLEAAVLRRLRLPELLLPLQHRLQQAAGDSALAEVEVEMEVIRTDLPLRRPRPLQLRLQEVAFPLAVEEEVLVPVPVHPLLHQLQQEVVLALAAAAALRLLPTRHPLSMRTTTTTLLLLLRIVFSVLQGHRHRSIRPLRRMPRAVAVAVVVAPKPKQLRTLRHLLLLLLLRVPNLLRFRIRP